MLKNVTINASLVDSDDEDDDFLAERGVDLELAVLPDGVTPRMIMGALFDGFLDRLKAMGVEISDATNFT